jgi:hypothetical protein
VDGGLAPAGNWAGGGGAEKGELSLASSLGHDEGEEEGESPISSKEKDVKKRENRLCSDVPTPDSGSLHKFPIVSSPVGSSVAEH